MTPERGLDDAPEDILERAYDVPAHLKDTRWEPVYLEILDRMKREANGLPMGTVHLLLMERIARFYVDMRFREENGENLSVKEQKEFNSFWLAMTQEFNKQLAASEEKLREQLVIDIQDILNSRLKMVADDKLRAEIRRKLGEDFARIGV